MQDGSIYLKWPGVVEFLISSDGCRVLCKAFESKTHQEALETYVLGPVLSFVLVRRGIEQLHSTAVVVGGKAIAFIGNSGYGKSTLGAAFLWAGYRLLTDDLLVLRKAGHELLAYPGPQRIKLLPNIATLLMPDRARKTRMNAFTSKLVVSLTDNEFQQYAVPLHTIYFLHPPPSRDCATVVRRRSRRQAFLELLRSNYNELVTYKDRPRHQFMHAAELAENVVLKSISYPRKVESLPQVRDTILRDLLR